MHIGPPPGYPSDHQVRADKTQPYEQALGLDHPTADAGTKRDMPPGRLRPGFFGACLQEETSESQLIARWRSRARSPMSIPVAVAT